MGTVRCCLVLPYYLYCLRGSTPGDAGSVGTPAHPTWAPSGAALLEYLAQSRIDGAHRSRLGVAIAACQTLEVLELPDVQTSIHMVEADPRLGLDGTPGQGAVAQVRLLSNIVCLIAVFPLALPLAGENVRTGPYPSRLRDRKSVV